MSVQSKGVLSSTQQLNYLFTWFNEFSELQKSDFLNTILNNYSNQECNSNGTQEEDTDGQKTHTDEQTTNNNNNNSRPMSIFQCRMKLFNEWFCLWNETEKQEFLTRVHNSDQQFHQLFVEKLNQNKRVEEVVVVVDQSVDQKQQQEEVDVVNDGNDDDRQALVDEEVVEDVVNTGKLDNGNIDDVVVSNDVIISDENNSLIINE